MTDKKAKEGTLENAVGYEPATKRKSPVYKLNPASFKEQVEQLSDTELINLQKEITAERSRRLAELDKRREVLGEEGK